jgi:hypothetical protein
MNATRRCDSAKSIFDDGIDFVETRSIRVKTVRIGHNKFARVSRFQRRSLDRESAAGFGRTRAAGRAHHDAEGQGAATSSA